MEQIIPDDKTLELLTRQLSPQNTKVPQILTIFRFPGLECLIGRIF